MSYDDALAWWFGRINYERHSPLPGDLKLDRMRELLHRLGNPHTQFSCVHVAGSKGKGSTCAMLESVLRQTGYRTGLFTSPHLTDVRERIQVDRRLIEPDELVACAAIVRPAVEVLEAEDQWPTFFEVGTALAFVHFARKQVEFAVIEVGLGGRFDSTNVITPLASLITSISLDHTAILGSTVEKIAFEKAGIIKPGVPVVSGVTEPGPRAVIERVAAERGAKLIQLGVDFNYERRRRVFSRLSSAWTSPQVVIFRTSIATNQRRLEIPVQLFGEHQSANAAVAVAAIDQLIAQGLAIPEEALVEGFRHVEWPARFERLQTEPLSILDCAHNVASVKALINTLTEHSLPRKRVLIFAASNDKDIAGMLAVLAPHFEKVYLTHADTPRAVPPERLAEALPVGSKFACYSQPSDAWLVARDETPPTGLIVVAGSVFLAGELRPLLLRCVPAKR